MIDTFNTVTEVVQGNDRIVKTSFNIKLLGYIVTDAVNALAFNTKKYFDKSEFKITQESSGKL